MSSAEGIDMQIPEEKAILDAVSGLGEQAQKALTKTVWKDGIDIEEANFDARMFANWIAEPYIERIGQLEAQNAKLIEALEIALDSAAQAMRQWRMFSEDREDRELSTDTDMEANLYRFTERRIEQARAALQQAKESK